MLEREKPDVVHVVTPPHTHVRIVEDCLHAGAHVLCEKPIAPTLAEYERVLGVAQSRGRQLMENHNYRFNAPIRAIRESVDRGELGEVREVEVRMVLSIRGAGGRYSDENLPHPSHRLPAGVLHEFISHLAYLALHFVPGPERVWAQWSNLGGGTLFRYDDLDCGYQAGMASARIRFSCHQAPDCFTVTVRGTKGLMHTDLFQPHLLKNVQRKGGAQLSPLVNQYAAGKTLLKSSFKNFRDKVMQVTPYEGLGTMLGEMYGAMAGGRALPVSVEQTRGALALIERLVALQPGREQSVMARDVELGAGAAR
jgi:predicted dehydrogenase